MKIQETIVWVLIILSTIIILWYILGNSPTLEQAILILILTLSITTLVKLKVLETKFNFLAKDFKEHKKHTIN